MWWAAPSCLREEPYSCLLRHHLLRCLVRALLRPRVVGFLQSLILCPLYIVPNYFFRHYLQVLFQRLYHYSPPHPRAPAPAEPSSTPPPTRIPVQTLWCGMCFTETCLTPDRVPRMSGGVCTQDGLVAVLLGPKI